MSLGSMASETVKLKRRHANVGRDRGYRCNFIKTVSLKLFAIDCYPIAAGRVHCGKPEFTRLHIMHRLYRPILQRGPDGYKGRNRIGSAPAVLQDKAYRDRQSAQSKR